MKTQITRPPIESLACVESECDLSGQPGQGNLTVRKVYGQDKIRYLRCSRCGSEFSERKGTALWNTKVSEARAVSVAEHLAEGCSQESTARLVKVDISVVKRLNREIAPKGHPHSKRFHHERVKAVQVEALQADERHGFSERRSEPAWEAEVIDPKSKMVLSHEQGRRGPGGSPALIHALFTDISQRVADPHDLVLFTDGAPSYATLFPHFFGTPYQPSRNGTARRMNVYQVRKSIAFSRRSDVKEALGWWGVTVYNWCRKHRSLRQPLSQPVGKKSTNSGPRLWPQDLPITFSQSGNSCSHLFIQQLPGDNLT